MTAVPATVKASSHNIYMAFQQGTAVVFLTCGDSGAPRQLTTPPTFTGPEDVLTGGGLPNTFARTHCGLPTSATAMMWDGTKNGLWERLLAV